MLQCAETSACARPQTPVDTQVGKVMYSGSTSYFFIPCHLEHASYVPQCETFVKTKSPEERRSPLWKQPHTHRPPFYAGLRNTGF